MYLEGDRLSDLYGATSLPELSPDPALRSSAPVPPAAPATGARSSYGKVNAPMRPAPPPRRPPPSARRNRGSAGRPACPADLNMMELLVIHRSCLRRLPRSRGEGGREGSDNISSISSFPARGLAPTGGRKDGGADGLECYVCGIRRCRVTKKEFWKYD